MNSRVTPAGKLLGKVSSRLAKIGRQVIESIGADGKIPNVRDDVCPSCACREGTVPNGCLQTQSDFLKCVSESPPRPFLCHAPHNGLICRGFIYARAGHVAAPMPAELVAKLKTVDYSPPDDPEPAKAKES